MEQSLKDLLSRLPIPGLKESADRHFIAEEITDLLTIPVKANQITLKDDILTVSVPPVVKSALHLKQEELFTRLNKKGISPKKIK